MVFYDSTLKSFKLALQPTPAWAAILLLGSFTILLILVGAGKILNFTFPIFAFAIAVFFYFRYDLLYVGFTWWIFFLTPLIRRLADYRGSFTDPSPILLAPYFVALVTLITLLRNLPNVYRQGSLPFILSIVGLIYSSLIGLIQLSFFDVAIALLDWLVPVLFGLHLFVNWQNYPRYRQNTEKTFIWGVLIMGTYGVFQYLVAPEWDTLWLENATVVSMGIPEPLGIRVWSTLNSPGVFSVVIMSGLLLLLSSKDKLAIPAMIFGYLSFLLSLVRSAWGGWVLGLLVLFGSFKASLQMRLISTVLAIALLVVPLTVIEPFSTTINERIETFSNVEQDTSSLARQKTFNAQIIPALNSFIGDGMGSKSFDIGLLNILFNLGWLGAIPYMSGILLLLSSLYKASKNSLDSFIHSSNSIAIAIFILILFGSPMIETSGVVLWGFLGLGLAGNKYNKYINFSKNSKNNI